MTANIRFITPLPWQAEDIGSGYSVRGDGNGHCIVFTNAASKSKHACRADIHMQEEQASNVNYIVHACNNYQRVVAAMLELVAVDEAADDGTHAGPFGAALDPARALLRELGELSSK